MVSDHNHCYNNAIDINYRPHCYKCLFFFSLLDIIIWWSGHLSRRCSAAFPSKAGPRHPTSECGHKRQQGTLCDSFKFFSKLIFTNQGWSCSSITLFEHWPFSNTDWLFLKIAFIVSALKKWSAGQKYGVKYVKNICVLTIREIV